MTDKMAAFTDQVIQALENARLDVHMTVNELLKKSGLKRSSYFRKMRGDTELTTGDIDKLARALGRDPMLVLAEAAEQAQAQESINNILEMAAKRGDTEAEQERERRVEETKRILADNPMELAAYTDPDKEKYIEYGNGDDPA